MTMQSRAFSTLLASAVIFGSSIAGCSGAAVEHRPSAAASQEHMLAPRIEKALADKDYARALTQAEELVAAAPNDGGYRALLGRAYLANGRYDSARTAFQDAMTLGNRDVRTIVSLSLANIGLGDSHAAHALLADHISDLPAADYGLAMAMAGDVEEGVRALIEATRQPEATAQTRQNLAYALALGGAWGQARLIAGQDLSARDAERRMGEWSRGGSGQQRVIAMLGVAPRSDDGGLPARLALHEGAVAPVQVAANDLVGQARADVATQAAETASADVPVAETPVATEAVVETAATHAVIETPAMHAVPATPIAAKVVAPAASQDAPSLAALFAQEDAPLTQAPSDPMREAARAAFQRSAAPPVVPAARVSTSQAAPAVAHDAAASDWVVQLGAYNSVAVAREKWRQISHGQPKLGGYQQVFSEATVKGRVFHRLAIRGFGDRKAAWATCQSLSAKGQACFVRLDDGADARMARSAVRKGGQVARQQASNGQRVAAR